MGLYIPILSEITQAEISKAPQSVQDILLDLLDYNCELLTESEESIELSEKYLKDQILSRNFESDASSIFNLFPSAKAAFSNV